MLKARAGAEHHDPLGPLHEAALGREPEGLGLGPLVGDDQRGPEDRHRQQGDVAGMGVEQVPGHRDRA